MRWCERRSAFHHPRLRALFTTHGTKIRPGFLGGVFILFTLFTYSPFCLVFSSLEVEKFKLSGLVRPLSKGKKKDVFEIGSYRSGLTLPDCVSLFYQ